LAAFKAVNPRDVLSRAIDLELVNLVKLVSLVKLIYFLKEKFAFYLGVHGRGAISKKAVKSVPSYSTYLISSAGWGLS
jgi:hypothetical protein